MNDNIRDREFLGRGLAFPLQYDPRGGIALASGENDIQQAIQIILLTAPGERVMRPEFGCRIHELVFASHNATTESLAALYVEEALRRWEPRIQVQDVTVSPDASQDGVLLVEIKYQVKNTHNQRSIVYPFYLADEP
jgi:phage baseplate assembly protein W